mmetsp:Transcript_39328/g.87531  ORF Transcript_39328/g.87531 Transcript_39328/m.87531 type:complete len:281 (-) Transcript_39328:801-1643(-)
MGQARQCGRLHLQGSGALVAAHLQLLPHLAAHVLHDAEGRVVPTQVHLASCQAQHRTGPGPAPGLVTNHLDLVNDRHVVQLVDAGHLNSARHVPRPRHLPHVLPSHHITADAVLIQSVIQLQGQKAQRGAVHPTACRLERHRGVVRLAAVGRARVVNDAALYGSCKGEPGVGVAQVRAAVAGQQRGQDLPLVAVQVVRVQADQEGVQLVLGARVGVLVGGPGRLVLVLVGGRPRDVGLQAGLVEVGVQGGAAVAPQPQEEGPKCLGHKLIRDSHAMTLQI